MDSSTASMLPSGTVTFLYTDIEGSASLWERYPKAMRAAQSVHDAILRDSITAQGGTVYKVIGDSFQAAFPVSMPALKAAVAIQRQLASTRWEETGPLRVRMGLHAGEAIPLEGDYDTTHTLNRVARIMSAGHGGQILISQVVAELVRGALPEGVTLKDLGQHRMKGLSQLEHLSQVCTRELPQDFPPMKTLDNYPNNLPAQLTAFIGREKEIDRVREGLSSSRLLTVIGPGGAGKTRLSLEVGKLILEEYPHGVWFVDLAPLQDPSMVPQAVAAAIGLREQVGRELTGQLADYLHNKQLLLILDNCEHLLEACAEFVDLALRDGAQTKVLATSRQSLNLTSEHVLHLDGMDYPEPEFLPDLRQYPAVQLFQQGVRQVRAGFDPQPAELASIVRICQLVQSMPLAILLAAGWAGVLDVEEIAAEISRNVDFLESESRDLPARQRSMRAVFEYSWDLLSGEERTTFAGMAVFHGGFDRRAAQEITGTNLRMLDNLVNKSLLRREAETRRFFIHEILRQLAGKRLEGSGSAESMRRAHGAYYLNYLARVEADLKGRRQLDALDEIAAEFDNLRAAWTWAVDNREAGLIDASLESLYLFTTSRSRFSEGTELFRYARTRWPVSDQGAPALAGRLLVRYPEPGVDPGVVYQQGLEIAHQHGLPSDEAYARNQLGRHLAHKGIDFERGMALLDESLSVYSQLGDDFATARVLDDLAFGYGQTDQEKRIQSGERSLALRRQIGDRIGVANVLRNLAVAAFWVGDSRGADRHIEEAVAIAREMGDLSSIAWMRSLQAESNLIKGDFVVSLSQIEEAQRISQELNEWDLVRNCLSVRAILISLQDQDYAGAGQLLLQANLSEYPADMLAVQMYYAQILVSEGLGEYDQSAQYLSLMFDKMASMGITFEGFYLLIPSVASILFRQGELELSACCLGYFDQLPKGLTGWGDRLPYLPQLRADLEAKLGRQAYKDALQQGATLDLRTIVERFLTRHKST